MRLTGRRTKIVVSSDGKGTVRQTGGLLLVETLRATGLDKGLSQALARWRAPRAVHDPGKIMTDLAVTLALGGDCLADCFVTGTQPVGGRRLVDLELRHRRRARCEDRICTAKDTGLRNLPLARQSGHDADPIEKSTLSRTAMAEDVYANKSFKEFFGTLIAPNALTQSQMVTMSTSGVPLTKVLAVLLRRFEPYCNNISKKILAMKSGRRTKADCFNQVYVMVAECLAEANITPILTEIKSGLTSKERRSVRTNGAALFLWSKYGL